MEPSRGWDLSAESVPTRGAGSPGRDVNPFTTPDAVAVVKGFTSSSGENRRLPLGSTLDARMRQARYLMTDLRDDPDVRALFRQPPDTFIAARDTLVRARKDAGDPTTAAKVKSLRKPTVPAWALDQLADREPEGIDALLEAGAELRAAQQAALSSTKHAGRLREATTARRAAIARLLGTASDVLRNAGRSPDPHAEDIAATLEAASVDDEAASLLRSGTFERPMRDPGGFGDVFGLHAVPDLDPEPEAEEPPTRRAPTRRAATPRPAHADLQAEANRLRRDRQAAERTARKTRETADRLGAEADAMLARLDVVEAKGRDAERAAEAAEHDAAAAIEVHDRALAALEAPDA